jgi:hypothetical protein
VIYVEDDIIDIIQEKGLIQIKELKVIDVDEK